MQLMCRAFNPGEARDAGATVERENRRLQDGSVFYVLDGKQRFTQGYLHRQIAIRSLAICDSLPPLDELQRFKQARNIMLTTASWKINTLACCVCSLKEGGELETTHTSRGCSGCIAVLACVAASFVS